ncbi:YbbR-like domain-containing protein [Tenacibaculum litopenaei]|uniref:hypothetical protein n=1 Tax=Tenacibaculum litopenaei TaxID=396016 RepID=UPI0038B4E650
MEKKLNIPKVFIGFLSASLLFWLLMNLSKTYTTTVRYEVKYHSLAQHRQFNKVPPKELAVIVKSSGFNLISTQLRQAPLTISLGKLYKKTPNSYYILTRELITPLQKQFASGLSVVQIPQDSLFFNISELQSKKVPVVFTHSLPLKKGFDLAAPLRISPDSVTISGNESQLKAINEINTKPIKGQQITDVYTEVVALDIPSGINSKQREVSLELNAVKFTEGALKVPVTLINLPKNKQLTIFPKEVSIRYKVGLADFDKITPASFEVYCDYQQSASKGLPYLIPVVKRTSNMVSAVRITPKKIDYLIHK